jgi:hypothetical protein
MIMEAPETSETSVNFYQVTRRSNPDGPKWSKGVGLK